MTSARPPSVLDLRARARRRLPRFAFDFLDGGAGAETGLSRNCAALDRIRLLPRALVNVESRTLETEFFGRRWSAPFGVAPIGMANLIWPDADIQVVHAARAANIPYILSTAATTSLETIAAIAPEHAWFQLYVGKSEKIVSDLIDRVDRAGFDVLVITVDVPAPGRRLRDLRNGLSLPLRPSASWALELMSHPTWSLSTLRYGAPRFANLEPYAETNASAASLASLMAEQSSGRLEWALIAQIRTRWKRRLVLKGILSPADALKARDHGADAIVVSNHGGRQLNAAPATIEALPAIRKAVGDDFPLIFDGGIRAGEDIAKALAAGADFTLLGRAVMYGAAAMPQGAAHVIDLLQSELSQTCAQLGVVGIDEIDDRFLFGPNRAV
jgi:isopentenyl diphosphate isomerase/L-lactate dehydrogenase-like FMN-dependent dehydrogenase